MKFEKWNIILLILLTAYIVCGFAPILIVYENEGIISFKEVLDFIMDVLIIGFFLVLIRK